MGRKKTPAFDLSKERSTAWLAIEAAATAADVMRHFLGGQEYAGWHSGGLPNDDETRIRAELLVLASFIRQHPAAPAEALYRYAAGQGIHAGPPEVWDAQPFWWRQAYSTFRHTLLDLDAAIGAERNDVLRQEQLAVAGDKPVLAAAIGGDMEGTALELQPDPLATREGMVLRRTDDGKAQTGQAAALPASGAAAPGDAVDGAGGPAGNDPQEPTPTLEAAQAPAEDVKDDKPAKATKSGKAA